MQRKLDAELPEGGSADPNATVDTRPAAPAKAGGRRRPAPPVGSSAIFDQDWWLDAVTCGRIEQAEVRWDSVTVGILPYFVEKRGLFRKIVLPPMTRIMTPRLAPPGERDVVRTSNKVKIIDELMGKVGKFDSYHTTIRLAEDLLLAYQLNRFNISSKLTFVSDAETPIEQVLKDMDQKPRNVVKTARKFVQIERHMDLERFKKLRRSVTEKDHNNYEALARVIDAVSSRGCGTFLSATDDGGHDLATAFLVWDPDRMYYLLAAKGNGPESNRAAALVFFESLAYSKEIGVAFDADGFATLASATALQRWGLTIKANANITKGSLRYTALKPVKDLISPPPF